LTRAATRLRRQSAAGVPRNPYMRITAEIPVTVTSQTGVQLAPRRQALFNWLALLTLLALIFI
jgi:hypothetical protein